MRPVISSGEVAAVALSATLVPRRRTMIRSQTEKTSGMRWLIRTTVTPCAFMRRMRSSTSATCRTLIAAVGSSISTILAFDRRVRAMARKEFLHIVRDVRSLTMALLVPLFMLMLFGYALSLDVDQIPTLIVDQDRTPASRELRERFAGTPYFDVLGVEGSARDVDRLIDQARLVNDLAERRKLYEQAMAIVRAERSVVYLWHRKNVVAHTARISGLAAVPDGILRFQDVRLAN